MPGKMMEIAPSKFNANPHKLFAEDWPLLCAGDFSKGEFNFMTIGWGTIGTIWGKPSVMVMVRPQRHTFKFMESCPDFTVCAFPKEYRKALSLCGAKSGKDCDKVKESGLTPLKSYLVSSPGFAEAELILECKKAYFDEIDPERMLSEKTVAEIYPNKDFHRIYFGELLLIKGTEKYSR